MTGRFCRTRASRRRRRTVSFAVAVVTVATVSAVDAHNVREISRFARQFGFAKSFGRDLADFSAAVRRVFPVFVKLALAIVTLFGPALFTLV